MPGTVVLVKPPRVRLALELRALIDELGLRDAVEQGRLRKGDLVLIVTVGAGYTTGGVLLRWAY